MSFVVCPRKGQGCPSPTGRHRSGSRAYQECLDAFTKGSSKPSSLTAPGGPSPRSTIAALRGPVAIPSFLNEHDVQVQFKGGETSDSNTLSMRLQYGLGDTDYMKCDAADPRLWHGKGIHTTSESPYSDTALEHQEELEGYVRSVYERANQARLGDPLWDERSQREQQDFLVDSVLGKAGEDRMDSRTHSLWIAHRTTPIDQLFERQADAIRDYDEEMVAKNWVEAGKKMSILTRYGEVIGARYGEHIRREKKRNVDDYSSPTEAYDNFLYLSDDDLFQKESEFRRQLLSSSLGAKSLAKKAEMGLKGIEQVRQYRENYRPLSSRFEKGRKVQTEQSSRDR